ncbi:Uncharacterised protein [Mycobacteroides abscessus subsp. abscessus]|nr:Uncharacterised protein [Mycobacteroides abscessus subsp. abscessus]
MRHTVERMSGHIQPQHLSFQGQLVLFFPLVVGNLDRKNIGGRDAVFPAATEEIELPHGFGLLGAEHRVDRVGLHKEKPLARMP